jgi:hypothetical protein
MSNVNWSKEERDERLVEGAAAIRAQAEKEVDRAVLDICDQHEALKVLTRIFAREEDGGTTPEADALFTATVSAKKLCLPADSPWDGQFDVRTNNCYLLHGSVKLDPKKRYAVALIIKEIGA